MSTHPSLLTLVAAVLIVGVRAARASDPGTPLLWWRFNEAAGIAYNDGLSGGVGNGQVGGFNSFGEPPLINDGGTAMRFNGGYVSPGHVADVNQNPGSPWTKRTVALWFRADDVYGRQVLFEQGGSLRDFVLYLDDDTLYFSADNRANDDGGGMAAPWGSPPLFAHHQGIEAGTTYYAVAVLDATATDLSGKMSLYLDGKLVSSVTGAGPIWPMNQVNLGQTRQNNRYHDNSTRNTGNDFSGVIDDFRLWNDALSESEIRDQYETLSFGGASVSGLRIIRWVEVPNP